MGQTCIKMNKIGQTLELERKIDQQKVEIPYCVQKA